MINDRIRKRHLGLAFAFAFAVVAAPRAQPFDSAQGRSPKNAPAPVLDDSDFAAFVKKATTKPEFLSPLVDHLPKKAGVPSPISDFRIFILKLI